MLACRRGDSYTKYALTLLLKCNYADNVHIQENKDHYVGEKSNSTRSTFHLKCSIAPLFLSKWCKICIWDVFLLGPPRTVAVPTKTRLEPSVSNPKAQGAAAVRLLLQLKFKRTSTQIPAAAPCPPVLPFPRGKIRTRGNMWSFTVG